MATDGAQPSQLSDALGNVTKISTMKVSRQTTFSMNIQDYANSYEILWRRGSTESCRRKIALARSGGKEPPRSCLVGNGSPGVFRRNISEWRVHGRWPFYRRSLAPGERINTSSNQISRKQ